LPYKKALTRLLDRPGGRFLLGKFATSFLRRIGGDGVEILYVHGMWTRRVGNDFFPDGLRFDYVYPDFQVWRQQAETYASGTRDYWLQHYKPQEGDTIVDVGAGRGEDTLTFSRGAGKTGRVIAVEPHPLSFAILKNFCRLNGLINVTLLELALMDQPGEMMMTESPSDWSQNVVGNGAGVGVTVQTATLDEICKAHGVKDIAFLKMNIEGAERHALLGMDAVLPRVRQICVACHDFRADRGDGEQFRTRTFVRQFLVKHGFTLAGRPDDPRNYVRDHVFGLRRG
jgi:FkbM family methyltransferase